MPDRAELIYNRLYDRMVEICTAVPPIDPENCYWLDSECGASYCREHAIEARGREFEFGVPIRDSHWFQRTDLEDVFWRIISSGRDGETESTEACSECGKTLSYILTDYGVDQELEYYLESPVVVIRPEDSYALDRLTLNVWAGTENRKQLLGVAAVIGQAYRVLREQERIER